MPNFEIVGNDGDPCPRCGQPTQVRQHKTIRSRELRGPFYYSKWFYCVNRDCQTNTIVPPRFRVWRDSKSADEVHRLEAIKRQLGEDDHQIGSPDWGAFKRRNRR